MVVEACAGAGHEQRRRRTGDQAVPVAHVGTQLRACCGVQRERPGDVVFGGADLQQAAGQVDVLVIEAVCLTGPHPGDGEQPEECLPGQRPQAGSEPAGRGDQGGCLFFGITVPAHPAVAAERQDARRGDLVCRIEGVQVAGEQPYRLQAPDLPLGPCAVRRVRRPVHCRLGRDQLPSGGIHGCREAHQDAALGGELVSQRPPHRQVLLRGLPQAAHRDAPAGQGRASGRSAVVLMLV